MYRGESWGAWLRRGVGFGGAPLWGGVCLRVVRFFCLGVWGLSGGGGDVFVWAHSRVVDARWGFHGWVQSLIVGKWGVGARWRGKPD
jgi:hypothetical protein